MLIISIVAVLLVGFLLTAVILAMLRAGAKADDFIKRIRDLEE